MSSVSASGLLPLSHDELVHGKPSLLGKMHGGSWQWTSPGKKSSFRGQELAEVRGWSRDRTLD